MWGLPGIGSSLIERMTTAAPQPADSIPSDQTHLAIVISLRSIIFPTVYPHYTGK